MFESKTVLLVGAGASAEFGLPTGTALFRKALGERVYDPNRDINRGASLSSYDIVSAIYRVYGTYPYLEISDQEFISKSKKSFETSIDMFSYYNDSVLDAAKFYSSWHIQAKLMNSERKKDRFGVNFIELSYKNNWKLPYADGKRNYIADVVRKYVEGCSSIGDVLSSNLSVVSFNYDKIFIDGFEHFLKNNEMFSEGYKEILPEVHHVYGELPFVKEMKPEIFGKNWNKINFINRVDIYSDHIIEIRNLIKSAEVIYIIGFSLDMRNVELIGLAESEARKYLVSYDSNRELQARAKQIGIKSDRVIAGSEASPMSLGRASELGLFSMHEFV